MRAPAVLAIAAALVLAFALSASGAPPEARPSAVAALAEGDVGEQGAVHARGTASRRRAGAVHVTGVDVDNGEAVVRTSAEDGTALAAAVGRTVSLLDGRVTAYGVRRVAQATVDGVAFRGRVEGLEVDGRRIGTVTHTATYPLGDGSGRVVVNRGPIGLQVVLDSAAGGLPAGTDLRVAVADAAVRRVRPRATATPQPSSTPADEPSRERERDRTQRPRDDERSRSPGEAVPRRPAPRVRTRLTRGGYAFPVHGEAQFTDTFGAPRQPAIGTHQGTDVFAGFGTPVLAVTDGVVSRVGTLEISGNRLWLTSDSGDAFFYAHLSAFAPAAVDGRRVEAGTVLGFVGNTGDAEPTPPHVHFEIHPGGMEEPAINPHPILVAWHERRDVPAGSWRQASAAGRRGELVALRDFIAE